MLMPLTLAYFWHSFNSESKFLPISISFTFFFGFFSDPAKRKNTSGVIACRTALQFLADWDVMNFTFHVLQPIMDSSNCPQSIFPFYRKEFLCSLRNHVQWQLGHSTALQPISLLYTGHWSVAFEQGHWGRIRPASDSWCMPQIRLCDTCGFESKELQSVVWLDHTHLPGIGSTLAVWLTFSRICERHHQAEGPYVLV